MEIYIRDLPAPLREMAELICRRGSHPNYWVWLNCFNKNSGKMNINNLELAGKELSLLLNKEIEDLIKRLEL